MTVPAITLRISEAPVITWSTTEPGSLADRLDTALNEDTACLWAIRAHLLGEAPLPAAIAGRLITVELPEEPGTEVRFTTPLGDLVRLITTAIGGSQEWTRQFADALQFYAS